MQFALLISVIVAILLSAVLLLTHVQSFFKIKSKELLVATEEVNKRLFESLDNTITTEDTIRISSETKNVKIATTYHGVWTKTFSEVSIRNRKISKAAFSGTYIDPKTPNLYLANKNAPLVVVGHTRLEGNSYLPKQGIKAGNISGHYYQGVSLYYGRTLESKETIPKLDDQWLSYIELLSKGGYVKEDLVVSLEKEIKNSFYNPVKIIYTNEPITLGNESISGNIVIQSASKIVITSASQLTDVLLIAPTIIVQNNVKGRFQLLATKKIEIGKRCHLSYPSSITLLDQKNSLNTNQGNTIQNKNPDLSIDKNSIIEGSVLYLKKKGKAQNRIKTHLEIQENVEITGDVYCQGNTELLGTVRGSLYTQQFIANQSGSVYLNHLYNGKVLKNPIPGYAGLPFKNLKKSIALWLY